MVNESPTRKKNPRCHRYDWNALIKEWAVSGKSPLFFCREKKIAPSGFYTWRNRLFPEGTEPKSPSMAFVPVKVEPTINKEAYLKGVTLTYPNGCKVQFHEAVELKLLAVLNQAMGV